MTGQDPLEDAWYRTLVREFLATHPEHVQGCRDGVEVDGRPEIVLDVEAVAGFVDWCWTTGRLSTRRYEAGQRMVAAMRAKQAEARGQN